MRAPHARSSTLGARILGAMTSTADADAIVGDIHEDLYRRCAAGRAPLWPRLWVAQQMSAALAGAGRTFFGRFLRSWRYTVRDAWRGLRAAPATTAFALLILTVGIAAATVTFSVVDTVILRSLPFEDQNRLVMVGPHKPYIKTHSAPTFFAWRDRADAFAALGATTVGPVVHPPIDSGLDRVRAWQATASVFEVLSVLPALGRTFTAEHEIDGKDDVAVISYDLWQRYFGGDPDVVGEFLRLAGLRRVEFVDRIVEIIGVMPPEFSYPMDIDPSVWIPHVAGGSFSPGRNDDGTLRASGYLRVVGRLREGARMAEAQAQLSGISESLAAADGWTLREDRRPVLVSFYDTLVDDVRGWMLLVLWAVVLVMLVAWVNVANLMLARAADRARELAVRASLGASPRQLGAGLLVESLMLSLTAAALGIVVAYWGVGVATAALPGGIARADGIALDLRVLVASVSAAIGAGVFLGLVPAWSAARVRLDPLLKDGAPTATPSRRMSRATFLVAEVSFVAMLLVVSTLFVLSFVRLVRADLGFARAGVVAFELENYEGEATEVVDALRDTAGVVSATEIAGLPPLVMAAFGGGRAMFAIEAADPPYNGVTTNATVSSVSPEYFSTMGIQLVAGRGFEDGDEADQVTIIDELAASVLFTDGRDPVGARVSRGPDVPPLTVIGIVRTISTDGPEQVSGTQMYFPRQLGFGGAGQFVVRTSGRAGDVAAIQATLVQLLPPGAVPPVIRPLDDAFSKLTAGRRSNAMLMLSFGVVVLLIGAAGIYSVMAAVVAQQRREFGVRVALGATGRQLTAGVLRQVTQHLGCGLLVGLVAGGLASRSFDALLFQVSSADGYIYVVVATLLLAVGLTAALVPAYRASRVDPLVTLRSE